MNKPKIKEVIVVEGKDDISAVKKAVEAEIIEVNGFAVKKKSTLEKIKEAQKRCGIIILTDPDYAGETIRKTIENYVAGSKHAYISRKEGTKLDNVGVENATPEAILKALEKARFKINENENIYEASDMIYLGLTGKPNSKELRQEVGSILKIGYANGKQFLNKLNHFNISKEELIKAINSVKND